MRQKSDRRAKKVRKVHFSPGWNPTKTDFGKDNMAARKRRFTDSEKKDNADIIYNEEMARVYGRLERGAHNCETQSYLKQGQSSLVQKRSRLDSGKSLFKLNYMTL